MPPYLLVELSLDLGHPLIYLGQTSTECCDGGVLGPLPSVESSKRLLQLVAELSLPKFVALQLLSRGLEEVHQGDYRVPDILVPVAEWGISIRQLLKDNPQ